MSFLMSLSLSLSLSSLLELISSAIVTGQAGGGGGSLCHDPLIGAVVPFTVGDPLRLSKAELAWNPSTSTNPLPNSDLEVVSASILG